MSVHHVTAAWQQFIDTLSSAHALREGAVEEEGATQLRIESREVRRILKGRRLPRSRRVFRGFDSPPGRF